MTPRAATQEQHDRAVELCRMYGPSEAARRLSAEIGQHIHRTTVYRWAKLEGVQSEAPERTAAATRMAIIRRKEIRERVGLKLWERAEGCLDEMLEASAQDKRHLAWAAGSCIINARLEEGEVTSRDEHHHVNESELDAEIRGLLGELAAREEAGTAEAASLLMEPLGEGEADTP